MTDEVDDFLEHYGVLGMHWGSRHSRGGYIGKLSARKARVAEKLKKEPASEDHTEVSTLRKKSTSSLSNVDLQKINTRLQLEQTYRSLSQQKSTIDKGQKSVKRVLDVANTAQQVHTVINSPLAKEIKKAFLKSAAATAK